MFAREREKKNEPENGDGSEQRCKKSSLMSVPKFQSEAEKSTRESKPLKTLENLKPTGLFPFHIFLRFVVLFGQLPVRGLCCGSHCEFKTELVLKSKKKSITKITYVRS